MLVLHLQARARPSCTRSSTRARIHDQATWVKLTMLFTSSADTAELLAKNQHQMLTTIRTLYAPVDSGLDTEKFRLFRLISAINVTLYYRMHACNDDWKPLTR